jgi:hypothetical protein
MERTGRAVDPWRILAGYPGYPEFEPKEEILTMEGEADAKLIAAAPELLRELELMLEFSNKSEPYTDSGMLEYKMDKQVRQSKARAAIKKARGEA